MLANYFPLTFFSVCWHIDSKKEVATYLKGVHSFLYFFSFFGKSILNTFIFTYFWLNFYRISYITSELQLLFLIPHCCSFFIKNRKVIIFSRKGTAGMYRKEQLFSLSFHLCLCSVTAAKWQLRECNRPTLFWGYAELINLVLMNLSLESEKPV